MYVCIVISISSSYYLFRYFTRQGKEITTASDLFAFEFFSKLSLCLPSSQIDIIPRKQVYDVKQLSRISGGFDKSRKRNVKIQRTPKNLEEIRRDADPIGIDDAMQIIWLHLPVLPNPSSASITSAFLLSLSISQARLSKPVMSRAWTLRTAKIFSMRTTRRLKRGYKKEEKNDGDRV